MPGSRRLSAVGDGAAALVFRRLAAPQILAPATRNGRACTARDVRQPHRCVLTAHPVRASVPSRANLDAQGGLDFLSVNIRHDAIVARAGAARRIAERHRGTTAGVVAGATIWEL